MVVHEKRNKKRKKSGELAGREDGRPFGGPMARRIFVRLKSGLNYC